MDDQPASASEPLHDDYEELNIVIHSVCRPYRRDVVIASLITGLVAITGNCCNAEEGLFDLIRAGLQRYRLVMSGA